MTQRAIGLLVFLTFAATLICAAIAMGMARQSDDRFEAERRAALHGAIEEFRAGVTDLARWRAREIATLAGARALRSPADLMPLLAPPDLARYRYDWALLIGSDGELAAAYPNAAVGPATLSAAMVMRADVSRRGAQASARPRSTEFVVLDDGPALMAAVPLPAASGTAPPAVLVLAIHVSTELVQALAQSAGLKDLSFSSETEPGREVRSLLDRNGRIIGWLSWSTDRPMTSGMARLSPLIVLVLACLLAFSALALWHLHRATRQLAASEERARKLAQEDLLTSLASQRHLHGLLEESLQARRPDQVVTFAHLDIDGFKEINDVLGRSGGDQLLVEFAQRLRTACPAPAAVGRLGGDEFAVLLTTTDAEDAARLLAGALGSVSAPYRLVQAVSIRVSMGIAQAPDHGSGSEELMRRAEMAQRAAKNAGGGRAVTFSAGLETDLQERALIKHDLLAAIAERGLDLHYQPVVAADGARIVGVEALLRWMHPVRGEIAPSTFVPIAEESGQMGRLGEFVLRRALTDAARWPKLFVAVNLSPVQVRDPELVDFVKGILAETGTNPNRLVLEITEGVLMHDPEQARLRLDALRAIGVRIALDDFGAGYSSLGYLQKFRFDKLKIDRGFVPALGMSGDGGVIVQAIVALGHALGVGVLAEGVETEEQRVLLRLAGCDEMQGFLFGEAMPAAAIDRLLAASGPVQGAAVPLRAIA